VSRLSESGRLQKTLAKLAKQPYLRGDAIGIAI
jgi:hypothetical protein